MSCSILDEKVTSPPTNNFLSVSLLQWVGYPTDSLYVSLYDCDRGLCLTSNFWIRKKTCRQGPSEDYHVCDILLPHSDDKT